MKPDAGIERTAYAEILEGVERIQGELERIGIQRPEQHRVTEMMDACRRILGKYTVDRLWHEDPDILPDYLQLVGAGELVRLFAQVESLRELRQLRGHLKLLVEAGFGPAASQHATDASRKLFELVFGLSCLSAFDDVLLEDPNHSDPKNPNPDIIGRFEATRFGIACKSISTTSTQGLIDNVSKAIAQIDAADDKRSLDFGIVAIDISRLIDPRQVWKAPNDDYWNPEFVIEDTWAIIDEARQRFDTESLAKELPRLFKTSKAVPCVLYYAHAAGLSLTPEGVAPTCFKGLRPARIGDFSRCDRFLGRLNRALHCQLRAHEIDARGSLS